MSAPSRVVVYGANGEIGSLVARILDAAGFAVVLAGRRRYALQTVARALRRPATIVTLSETTALVSLAASAQLVVNCAGPFAQTGQAVLDACLHAGTHYVDVCGESRFVGAAFAHRDAIARARNLVVCPGMGAKGALGDWAVSLLHRAHGEQTFDVGYAHEGHGYWRPSLGALLSVAHEGVAWEAQRPLDHGLPPRMFAFPPPMRPGYAVLVSGTEQLTAAWQRPARVRSYLSVDPGTPGNVAWSGIHEPAFAWLTRPTAPRLWRALLEPGQRDVLRRRLGPRGRGAMTVVAETESERLSIFTSDPYAVTAAIVLETVAAIARNPGVWRGVLAPSQVLPPTYALAALQRHGLARVYGWS